MAYQTGRLLVTPYMHLLNVQALYADMSIISVQCTVAKAYRAAVVFTVIIIPKGIIKATDP